ncbi:MAG: hypothetical protein UD936_00770 [Acutalibacteraceae bacterium]|nr:hypothetical protein [Acutalibacteraceae bacterium]
MKYYIHEGVIVCHIKTNDGIVMLEEKPLCAIIVFIAKKGIVCDAFPDGIPRELMLRGEHDTPFPGDNGIRYKPKEV